MNKKVAFFMAVLLSLCCIQVCAQAEDGIVFSIEAPETVKQGEEFNVVIKISYLSRPITAFELTLSFDATVVTPKITDNGSMQMNSFLTVNRQGWEQLCRYDSANSRYHLRFCTVQDSSGHEKPISEPSDIVITLPFTAAEAGVCPFRSTELMAFDSQLNLISGADSERLLIVGTTDSVYSAVLSFDGCEDGFSWLEAKLTNIGRAKLSEISFELGFGLVSPAFDDLSKLRPIVPDGWSLTSSANENNKLSVKLSASPSAALDVGGSMTLSLPFVLTGASREQAEFTFLEFSGSNGAFGTGTPLISTIGAPKGFAFTDSSIYEKDGYIYGCTPSHTASELQAVCRSKITFGSDRLFTGCKLVLNDGTSATVVIKGDINGSGEVDATDYLLAKRICIGSYLPTALENEAAKLSGDTVTALDYYKIKMHVLGKYNIFA